MYEFTPEYRGWVFCCESSCIGMIIKKNYSNISRLYEEKIILSIWSSYLSRYKIVRISNGKQVSSFWILLRENGVFNFFTTIPYTVSMWIFVNSYYHFLHFFIFDFSQIRLVSLICTVQFIRSRFFFVIIKFCPIINNRYISDVLFSY